MKETTTTTGRAAQPGAKLATHPHIAARLDSLCRQAQADLTSSNEATRLRAATLLQQANELRFRGLA